MNEWDDYVMFAMQFQWTPAEVDALDPDFVDSLTARMEAESRVSQKSAGSGKSSTREDD